MPSFNLKHARSDEDRRIDVQRKIMEFLIKERPVDSNIYLSPDTKEVLFSIGDAEGNYDAWTEKLQEKLGKRIKVENCDECGCPENWTPALGAMGFSHRSVVIGDLSFANVPYAGPGWESVFSCDRCEHTCSQKEAASGCPKCNHAIFRVARREMPLIQNPQKDPYRPHDNQEDGYKMTTPGGEGDISGSALGQNSRFDRSNNDVVGEYHRDEYNNKNHRLPEDMDAFDISANPEPDRGNYSQDSSIALTDDDSPLNPLRYKEPKYVGPHNMPHPGDVAFNNSRTDDVYERIRRRMKGNK